MQDRKIQDFNFFHQLMNLPFVDRIFLFGSRARGDNMERADIDLAIDCPKATKEDWFQVLDIIDDADTLLQIDCVRFDELSPNYSLRQSIEQDKVVLFEREKTI